MTPPFQTLPADDKGYPGRTKLPIDDTRWRTQENASDRRQTVAEK